MSNYSEFISNKKFLITGGAGSVGQALVDRLVEEDVDVIRMLDNHEPGLSRLKSKHDDERLRFLLGDVRDKDRLGRAMQDIDVVIHTAAMKHVDISEYNPFEAVKTNVVGLQNVVDTAIDSTATRLVFTSSDKSVHPANTMGTTKLLGEKLVAAGNKYSGRSDLNLASVRFGNVLGSSESVVPLFREQIRDGGPVTLTDERMSRFFITERGISDLVLEAATSTRGGEVFLHEMSAARIECLAESMIEILAPQHGYDPEDIDIEIVGRRVGETLHEKVMTEREAARAVKKGSIYAIPPEKGSDGYLSHEGLDSYEPPGKIVRSSEQAEKLSREEIAALLERTGVC
ncbi:SDR family NAD(P)-dependent oxidoreductase [Halomicroarcula sp. GCM10025817]|uniref:SDR family NAD(P)-dependent oxidoreductase n=1 Tax=Halomicroarcula sp. GCM10025817 TaxID=3252672 RepID=UPI00361331D8